MVPKAVQVWGKAQSPSNALCPFVIGGQIGLTYSLLVLNIMSEKVRHNKLAFIPMLIE